MFWFVIELWLMQSGESLYEDGSVAAGCLIPAWGCSPQ